MLRLIALVLALCSAARAVNTIEREFTCPLDGHTFKLRIETSSRPSGVRLDLRKLGDVVEPPTAPQCPKCRLVLFTENWTPPLVEKLKPFVLGPDFQQIASKNPSYFCLAQIQEFLRAPAIYSAHSYLRASWQVEDRDGPRDRCLAQALDRFNAALSVMKTDDAAYANTVLLCGEIERRLRRWDAARARFSAVRDSALFSSKSLQAVIARQLELIASEDSAPRPALPDPAKPGEKNGTPPTPRETKPDPVQHGPDHDWLSLPELPEPPAGKGRK